MKSAAVIGLGMMGANHARVYSQLKNIELVGCSDISEKNSAIAKNLQTNFYSDYKDLLSNESPDLVSICVPTTLHKNVAAYTLSKGINTLVEKPIADSEKNALAIIKAAKKSGAKLMTGHIERFNPVIRAIKEFIFSNCHKILSIDIQRVGPIPPRIKDVGVVLDLGTHDIDLVTYLTGEKIKLAYCTTNSYTNALMSTSHSVRGPSKKEDSAHINLTLKSGISASITTNWLTPYKQRKIEVITDKSVVQGNLLQQELMEFTKHGDSYEGKALLVEKAEPLALELQAFVDSVSSGSKVPVSGEDGLYALKVAQLCLKSAKGKRVIAVR